VFTVQGFGNKKWSAIWAIRQHPKNAVKKLALRAVKPHFISYLYIYGISIHIWGIYMVFMWKQMVFGFCGMYIYIWDLDGFIWENTKHHSNGLYGQNKT
jgi:hypothetical protein